MNDVHPLCFLETVSAETCGGTAANAPCVLPFTYKGKTYNSCTTVDSSEAWCATESVYKSKWGYCDCHKGAYLLSYIGGCVGYCLLIFVAAHFKRGGTQSRKGMRPPRMPCGISRQLTASLFCCCFPINMFVSPLFLHLCSEETCGGTAQGVACVFPFIYKGKSYKSCTTVDNSNKLWCSTESVYKSKWGNCDCGMRDISLAVLE